MKIAILGATSEIAKDLIVSFSDEKDKYLYLFARRPQYLIEWLNGIGLLERKFVDYFDAFGPQDFDVIINFVGSGDPFKIAEMGTSIFEVTIKYDELVINYLQKNPKCRYIFLSSGVAYCSSFDIPVDEKTKAVIDINNFQPQNSYAASKLYAECRHRAPQHIIYCGSKSIQLFQPLTRYEIPLFYC